MYRFLQPALVVVIESVAAEAVVEAGFVVGEVVGEVVVGFVGVAVVAAAFVLKHSPTRKMQKQIEGLK